MPYEQKMALLARARERMPVGVQQVMKTAAAKCAVEHGRINEAQDFLNSVITDPLSDDPVYLFHGIATSNKQVVQRMIDRRRSPG
jgi:hypothetical protein